MAVCGTYSRRVLLSREISLNFVLQISTNAEQWRNAPKQKLYLTARVAMNAELNPVFAKPADKSVSAPFVPKANANEQIAAQDALAPPLPRASIRLCPTEI